MLNIIALVVLAGYWIAWWLAFLKPRVESRGRKTVRLARSSVVGILLNLLGFALVCAWVRPPGFHKTAAELVASMLLGAPAVGLVWSATRQLRKEWRYTAAITEKHDLVQTGPYAVIRHPIYASMLLMLLSTGAAWTWWPMMVAALVLFLIGLEIRVHAEDKLLAAYFQDEFFDYESRVPAYIPFLR